MPMSTTTSSSTSLGNLGTSPPYPPSSSTSSSSSRNRALSFRYFFRLLAYEILAFGEFSLFVYSSQSFLFETSDERLHLPVFGLIVVEYGHVSDQLFSDGALDIRNGEQPRRVFLVFADFLKLMGVGRLPDLCLLYKCLK